MTGWLRRLFRREAAAAPPTDGYAADDPFRPSTRYVKQFEQYVVRGVEGMHEATGPVDVTIDTCAICGEAIAVGAVFLIAPYGPVHLNGACEHQPYHYSRTTTIERGEDVQP